MKIEESIRFVSLQLPKKRSFICSSNCSIERS